MASSNSESHADGLLSRLRRIPNFFAELKCDRVQAFAYNRDIQKLVSFKTSDAFIELWGVPQDCLSSEPPCSAAHSAFAFDNLLQAANLVATAFLHPEPVLNVPSKVSRISRVKKWLERGPCERDCGCKNRATCMCGFFISIVL